MFRIDATVTMVISVSRGEKGGSVCSRHTQYHGPFFDEHEVFYSESTGSVLLNVNTRFFVASELYLFRIKYGCSLRESGAASMAPRRKQHAVTKVAHRNVLIWMTQEALASGTDKNISAKAVSNPHFKAYFPGDDPNLKQPTAERLPDGGRAGRNTWRSFLPQKTNSLQFLRGTIRTARLERDGI